MQRRLVYALFGVILAAACRREVPPPPVVHPPDIELRAETVTVESRVPQHATLDGLLRGQAARRTLCHCRHRGGTLGVQSASTALRSSLPSGTLRWTACCGEFEYQIDADRFLRIIAADRAQPAATRCEVVPYDKQVEVVAMRGRIDGDHPR